MDKVVDRGSTIFLRGAVFVIGLIVLGLCLTALPAGLRSAELSLYHPIFMGMYVSAVPFFYALHQTLRLLSCIDSGAAFSRASVEALKRIKYCAVVITTMFSVGLPYIYLASKHYNSPGVMLLGVVIAFAAAVIGVFAAVLQKLLQSAMDIKSENDLTV